MLRLESALQIANHLVMGESLAVLLMVRQESLSRA